MREEWGYAARGACEQRVAPEKKQRAGERTTCARDVTDREHLPTRAPWSCTRMEPTTKHRKEACSKFFGHFCGNNSAK